MKNIYFLLLAFIIIGQLSAQSWLSSLPQDKLAKGEVTFYEHQKAFNDYWEPFNVENGYYDRNGEKVKAPYWKQFKRWEWYWENRIDPATGEFPNTSAWEELQKHLKENPEQKSPTGNWTGMGPSGTSGGYAGLGRLNCVAFAANDANTIYVGAASGGIWGTTNGGSAWTPLGDNNAVLGVSDIICISPVVGPDILYIGTGDRDGGSMWSLGGGQSNDNNSVGILKSTDAGATWNTTSLSFVPSAKQTVNRMLMDPTDGTGNTQIAATSSGLYKTTDGWATKSLLSSTHFVDIKFKPGTPSTIYASNWYGDIYRSTNSGASFSSVFTSGNGRVELATTANNSNVVYAVMESGGGLGGVYKSTNSGASFSQIYTGSLNFLGWNCNGGDSGGQGSYDLCIAADPTNANNVFIGGVNTWKSTDGGVSWSATTHWSGCSGITTVHADQHYLAYQNGTSTLFLCNDGGIYKTTNNGSSWTHHGSGLITSQIYRMGTAQTTSNDVILGLQDNGTKAMLTGTWSDELGGDGFECAVDWSNQNTMYGELYYGDIRRSTNHGGSWTSISSGITGSSHWCTPFVLDANTSSTLYIGYSDVWKSTNQGTSWSSISSWGGSTIRSLAVTPASSNTICAATQTTLYRTTNGGTSWSNITGTLPTASASITYVWIKSTDVNTIWVSLGGYNSLGVYETTNGGATWTNISAGLPALPVMSIIQNKQNTSQNELYAATDVGVYVKVGSANWTPFYSGLPNVVVAELDIYYDANPLNSRLRAATYGRGLWESDMYTNPTPDTWAGSVNSNWNLGANWVSGNVPTAVTNVIIPNAPVNWPVKTGNLTLGSDCKDLTITSNAQLTVNGDFTINSGQTFVMNTGSNLKIDGDWNNNGTFTPGMGIVDFTGIANATINAPGGGQVNLINDNIATWPGNWNGDINSGNSFWSQDAGSEAGGVSPQAMFTYATAIGTYLKQLYYNPVNTTGLSSITLDFKHMLDHYSGTGNYTVKVQYSVDGTNWNDAGWSITPSANIPATPVSLTLTSAQGVGAPNYYISFTLSGNVYYINYWYIDDVVLSYNMAGTDTFFDLTVSKTNAMVETNGNLNINGNLNLKPAAQFTNSTGNTLNVTGNSIFEADGSGFASFIDNGTSAFTVAPLVQQYLTNNVWHFVGIPVTGALTGIYNGIYLRTFDEPSDSWSSYITPTGQGLDNSIKGYAAWAAGSPATVQFNGSLKNGPYSIPVTDNQSTTTNSGWNLVGNPYPSSLDWDAGLGWSKADIDNTIYYYSGNIGMNNYHYYVGSGTAPYIPPVVVNQGTNEIPPQQGFFVHATATTGALSVNNNARIHSGQTFYKETTKSDIPLIRIEAEGNGLTDETVVRFFTEANAEFDSDFDAYKLFADEYPQVYTKTVLGTELAISTLPEITEELVIPVSFSAPTENTYSFTFTELIGFDEQGDLYLEDLLANQIVEVDENTIYTFTYSSENVNDRFLLHFSNPLSIDDNFKSNQVSIYSYNNVVYISKPESFNGDVFIYDILGKEVFSDKAQGEGLISIPVTNGMGYYLVKVKSNVELKTAKVFIK